MVLTGSRHSETTATPSAVTEVAVKRRGGAVAIFFRFNFFSPSFEALSFSFSLSSEAPSGAFPFLP